MSDLEILALLVKAKELGIGEAEIAAFKLRTTIPVEELKAEEIVAPTSVLDDLSEQEILYYATPYFDELMERKNKGAVNG